MNCNVLCRRLYILVLKDDLLVYNLLTSKYFLQEKTVGLINVLCFLNEGVHLLLKLGRVLYSLNQVVYSTP